MAVVMLPLDATSGSPSFTAQQTRQAFSAFLGAAPSGRPLGAISGVRPGTPTTTVVMSGGGSTTWNVAAHSGVLDTQSSIVAGPYAYATDGTDTGAITAANATNPRIDIIYVKVNDNVQDGSGLTSGQVLYLAGTAAATPAAPAVPARGMVLANINVPTAGGGAPTVSWVAPTFGSSAVFTEVTSSSSSTSGTTELVVASQAFAADGASQVIVEFTAVAVIKTVATDVFNVILYDGPTAGSGTPLATWNTGSSGTTSAGVYVRKILIPSAGAHTYTARLVRSSGTGTAQVYAQTGPPPEPMCISVMRVS